MESAKKDSAWIQEGSRGGKVQLEESQGGNDKEVDLFVCMLNRLMVVLTKMKKKSLAL